MPKAAQTRALIIEKTAPVFNTKGFAGTSLTEMEKATGLTKGSIYNNFKDKDEVALAVFDYNLQKVNAVIQAKMSQYNTAKDQLLAYVKVYNSSLLKLLFTAGGCPILNTAIESDDTHPALRKKASAAVEDWKETITGLIHKAIQEKEFRPSIQAEEVALTIIAMIEGGIMISRVTGRVHYLKKVLRSVEKMILDLT